MAVAFRGLWALKTGACQFGHGVSLKNGKNLITDDVRCVGEGARARGTAVKIALERRGWS